MPASSGTPSSQLHSMPSNLPGRSSSRSANRWARWSSSLLSRWTPKRSQPASASWQRDSRHTDTIKPITCPFTGEVLTAVPALNPDVGIIHAQRADRAGNVQMWGITGVQKEVVLASRRSLVTVEEIVPELTPVAGGVTLPTWTTTYVAPAPGGTYPSYALGYTDRDNRFYQEWDAISRDRDTFNSWLDGNVYA